MEKRYQVFVSSTYADLQDERKEIIQALLELDCIPAGMEMFPAATDDQWTLIQKVIQDCDYYVVVVAGKYGSIDSAGVSFTEKEYRYALHLNKPIIGFVHKDITKLASEHCESDKDKREKLESFIDLVKKKHVKFWSSPAELGSVVSRSLVQAIKSHPAIGWVRGDQQFDENIAKESLRLRAELDLAKKQLESMQTGAPAGTDELSQGDEQYELKCMFKYKINGSYRTRNTKFETYLVTWNQIFSAIAPAMIQEADVDELENRTAAMIAVRFQSIIDEVGKQNSTDGQKLTFEAVDIDSTSFDTIVVQLKALGLIKQSVRQRSLKDQGVYWTLTTYGDAQLTRLRAIKKVVV